MSETVCSIPKNSKETIQFRLSEFKGKHYLDMRIFTLPENGGGQNIPSKKGLTLAVDLYPQFRAALAQVETVLRDRGLIAQEDIPF